MTLMREVTLDAFHLRENIRRDFHALLARTILHILRQPALPEGLIGTGAAIDLGEHIGVGRMRADKRLEARVIAQRVLTTNDPGHLLKQWVLDIPTVAAVHDPWHLRGALQHVGVARDVLRCEDIDGGAIAARGHRDRWPRQCASSARTDVERGIITLTLSRDVVE